jgi:hypothetical protein
MGMRDILRCIPQLDLSCLSKVKTVTRRLRSQTESKPSNTGCLSGVPLSSVDLTTHTLRVPLVAGEDTGSTVAGESQYVNPLGVSDAEDWEHYQGCKNPMFGGDALMYALQQQRTIASLESENAILQGEIAELRKERELRRQEAQVATYKPLYGSVGLPTDDKERKRLQLWTFMFEYFPDAWLAVVNVAVAGNEQHNPGQPLHWAREKSTDQMNTAFRHQWDYGRGVKKDTDGQWHLAKAIWRLMAQLQLDIEKERSNNDQ